MPLIGTLLKKGLKLRGSLAQEYSTSFELQRTELKELLLTASQTEFANYYDFISILQEFRDNRQFYEAFKKIPVHDYNKMYEDWWKLSLQGVKNISWPGKVNHFALSSGTSESASKRIPITRDMTKAIQRTSIRQILSLSKYNLPSKVFESGILMIGGSTNLQNRGSYFEGDLSGIQAARLPFWFQHFYKPGKRIAKNTNWEAKMNQIIKRASHWNIGVIVGVPAWIQILLEKIVAHYQVADIHEIWPNLMIYVHGGVSFDPYRKSFEKLLAHPIHYIETYLASEGFIAYQNDPGKRSMKLVLNNGIFYEFIPFDENNFLPSGEVSPQAAPMMIDEVEEGKDYAILLSTCAGAWRYLIGDVVRFTSVREAEIQIVGRTKHFLSLCGEHLSVDNMNKAIELISNELNIDIKEFTVAGVPYGSLFAHHWFIGTDHVVDKNIIREKLDTRLKSLNDDYEVERGAALKEVMVDVLPIQVFYEYMEVLGKTGGQNKFPRVIKGQQLEHWLQFVSTRV